MAYENIQLDKLFTNHEKSVYWSSKNIKPASEYSLGSRAKGIFNCSCGHEFESQINYITNGSWCPYCCKNQKKVCGKKDCDTCYKKSFASHPKAEFWSHNNKDKPYEYLLLSNKKVLFLCKCGHEFETSISAITNGNWCPYCCKFTRKLCGDSKCKLCLKKSFASHPKAKFWSDKNPVKPINCALNSHNKYIFNCNLCLHEFSAILNFINNGGWCAYCSNPPKKLCDNIECNKCFNKSFASHEKSKYWCKTNNISPRNVIIGSRTSYKFICEKNHKFTTKLSFIYGGSWCPKCINKTEQKLFEKLSLIYNDLKFQYKPEWCINNQTLLCFPFDFLLPDEKIIIELDGIQHFKQVSNWENPVKVQERDKYKMNKANENGYSVIRLLQEDVYNNSYNWLEELQSNINKIIFENKIQNIYMCKKNEYIVYNDILYSNKIENTLENNNEKDTL